MEVFRELLDKEDKPSRARSWRHRFTFRTRVRSLKDKRYQRRNWDLLPGEDLKLSASFVAAGCLFNQWNRLFHVREDSRGVFWDRVRQRARN